MFKIKGLFKKKIKKIFSTWDRRFIQNFSTGSDLNKFLKVVYSWFTKLKNVSVILLPLGIVRRVVIVEDNIFIGHGQVCDCDLYQENIIVMDISACLEQTRRLHLCMINHWKYCHSDQAVRLSNVHGGWISCLKDWHVINFQWSFSRLDGVCVEIIEEWLIPTKIKMD